MGRHSDRELFIDNRHSHTAAARLVLAFTVTAEVVSLPHPISQIPPREIFSFVRAYMSGQTAPTEKTKLVAHLVKRAAHRTGDLELLRCLGFEAPEDSQKVYERLVTEPGVLELVACVTAAGGQPGISKFGKLYERPTR